jgi:hypothetical protein
VVEVAVHQHRMLLAVAVRVGLLKAVRLSSLAQPINLLLVLEEAPQIFRVKIPYSTQ